ncbi:hypothetical protein MMC28_004631 [Mycoblastus sanguinarius]|nr:hypothetical protein [Mycoblastus sanguinarius]
MLHTQDVTTNIPALQQQNPSNALSARGGRGGERGTQNHEGLRGGRRGGRGIRGNRADGGPNQHARRFSSSKNQSAPPRPPPPGLGGGGSFGGRLTKDAESIEGEVAGEQQKGGVEPATVEDVEAEVCFICASPVVHNSVAPCNHRTCHICALRLRALYKTRACAHCRTDAKFVIFTDDATKRYEGFVDADFQETDEVLGIKYEQKDIHADTVLLLRYNCPDHDCDIACWGWPDLHRHVKDVHRKVLCDLCTRNKKVFTHEHELFTQQELRKHEKFGDDNPGAVDQSGFKGHPECGFCRQRFYGDDELYVHCREKHEKCHICDRRNPARQQQYYVDYNSLEQHFRSDHFLCADQECMDKKFVVFESEMDLKAHQLEAHPNGLTKDARRDARRVDISAFDYRTPHQDHQGGRRDRGDREGRDGRGRGRGRDPNTEALPQSTAQPLRRDELAYQRQMAVQNAQAATARTFGGQLTSIDAYAARPAGRSQDTVTAPSNPTTTNTSFPAIDNLNLNPTTTTTPASPTPAPALTAQEQARRLQHSAVMDRASAMLKHDQTKIPDFRSGVSSYRTSVISAPQLIDSFFSLFDAPSADLGKLVKELANIYESEDKRNGLLKAWNDWRAINEDYPLLPGPSGVLPGSSAAVAGSGGHRVLKLKSSTAQSSRSAVSKQGSWGNAANANPFPSVPASSANRAGAGRVSATPWIASSASKPSPASSRPTSRPPASGKSNASATDAFPALPAAAKPNTTIFGLTRGTVRWDDGRSNANSANPWGGANGSIGASTPATPLVEGDEEPELGKKKGKNKKQTLYKFG